MTRRITLHAIAAALVCLGTASAASAAPIQLLLSQSAAFSLLGHSCGGIQEQVYATGFQPASGYPAGEVYMQTRCGGSGRGGGYKTTTYSAWAGVTWDWFGQTRSYAKLEGPAEASPGFAAEDDHGDRIYDSGTSAFLETGEPPLQPPAAPTALGAEAWSVEAGEEEEPILRFTVSWTPAPDTASLITSSTVTATPVGNPSAPILTATVDGPGSSAVVQPLRRHTTYRITVTSTDAEGTSEPSAPIEAASSGAQPSPAEESCEQNSGTIKLSPGLSETPHVQQITIKGELSGCDGPAEPSGGSYVAHLTTNEEVTCSALTSLSAEPTTSSVSLVVKWSPKGIGSSHGSLLVSLSEAGGNFAGTLEGGPFATPQGIFASSLWESFSGGPTCGVPPEKGKAKPVKTGTFATSPVEIGA